MSNSTSNEETTPEATPLPPVVSPTIPVAGPVFPDDSFKDLPKKLIITDIDETVLVFAAPFQAWMESRGYVASAALSDTFHIPDTFGISEDRTTALLFEFMHTPEFGSLAPKDDALAVLPKLHKKGWRFVGVTACANYPGIVAARKANLEAAFGFEREAVHCTGMLGGKESVLRRFRNPAVWVEDHLQNALAGAAAGHRTFLITRPYNEGDYETITRVTSWRDIAKLL